MVSLYDEIKTEAENLGFCIFGITSPEPLSSFSVYQDWITHNRNAGMAYLSSERAIRLRSNPASLLPDCKSVLVVGMTYPAAPVFSSNQIPPTTGNISSYAWGIDYHEVILPRLNQLVKRIEQKTSQNIQSLVYTDTGPVLEKALGQRAGLGWVGKNSCLINPTYGSYYFLGEVFLDLPLPTSDPFPVDRCGKCQRCIDSCPTGCILPNRTIDASRCISYLTIENKGIIPRELRPYMGNHIFGCDICQQVCPWNHRKRNLVIDPELSPSIHPNLPLLMNEILLSETEFRVRYRNTPVYRAKRRGYLRNVAVALGNSKDDSVIPILSHTLINEEEELIRIHTAWALGQFQTESARKTLNHALKHEKSEQVLEEIILAIA